MGIFGVRVKIAGSPAIFTLTPNIASAASNASSIELLRGQYAPQQITEQRLLSLAELAQGICCRLEPCLGCTFDHCLATF